MNPCWILPGVDLSHVATLTAAVGQVPFNFQIGKDIETIKLKAPRTPAGELEVRLDTCEGEPITVLPLSSSRGPHDLCFTFTQRTLDPMWAIDWVQLAP